MKNIALLLIAFILFSNHINSQKIKLGNVTKDELLEKIHPLDSNSDAAFLEKSKKTHFEYDGENGWTIITDIYIKLKLYSKEGFDYAQEEIYLYEKGGKNVKVRSIKGHTYNLVNGKIEETKLLKDQIFKEEANDNFIIKKFTMPSLKKGAIVEWKYTIQSPYYWHIGKEILQHEIPINVLKTEIRIPEYFVFKQHAKGYLNIPLSETKENRKIDYSYRTDVIPGILGEGPKKHSNTLDFSEKVYTIISHNVPAIKEEPYISNINNYKSSIDFELSYTDFPNSTRNNYSTGWDDVCKDVYKSNNFGLELNKHNYFKEDLASLNLDGKSENQKITAIFEFVKNKLNWDKTASKYTKYGVKKAYKTGVGNSADINLILIAMLREAGLLARPILSSTRSHGIPLYPTRKGLNYVIASVKAKTGEYILLDATEKFCTPNRLPLRVMNWNGRLITKDGRTLSVPLKSKIASIESQQLSITIDSNFHISGFLKSSYSNLLALNFRNKNNELTEEKQISNLEKDLEIDINKYKIINKNKFHKPISRLIQFETDDFVEHINNKYYINPELFLQPKINPFKEEVRNFPIDYGTPWEKKLTIKISIPKGYVIESIPETLGIGLPNNIGEFIYSVKGTGNNLNLSISLKINSDIIIPEYYPQLKKYYKTLIAKQAEKIVLVKK